MTTIGNKKIRVDNDFNLLVGQLRGKIEEATGKTVTDATVTKLIRDICIAKDPKIYLIKNSVHRKKIKIHSANNNKFNKQLKW